VEAENGQRFFDGSSGAMCVNLGHGNRRIVEALVAQASAAAYANPSVFAGTSLEVAAERLSSVRQDGDSVLFSSTGTSAIELAIGIAWQFHRARGETARRLLISARLGNHGSSALCTALSGHPRRAPLFDRATVGVHQFDPPFRGWHDRSHPERRCDARCISAVEDVMREVGPRNVAAVLLEPVSGATGGAFVPPDGWLTALRRMCDLHGVLVIHDEVLTGLGRTGFPLAAQRWGDGAAADVTVLAKGLGAGYAPISALLIGQQVMGVLMEDEQSLPLLDTMAGNPVGAAVAVAVLDQLEELGFLDAALERGVAYSARLAEACNDEASTKEVRGVGFLHGVEVVSGRLMDVLTTARNNGLILYTFGPSGPDGTGQGVIVAPPLTCSAEELDWMIGALSNALAAG
jgi:adenosylmethionine-8-amino-7-oxononanoate aminotransferase